ncbi:MAG TPA: hypothetical protein VFB61_10655 [Gemmatimonadales bacterium]|nr:hypothetical protein [Gemmatimonadales bacterium]
MAVSLPYRFDTSPVIKLILRGVLGLLLVVIAGMLYSLLVTHDQVAAVQLLLVTVIILYFGRLFLGNLETSRGTIDRDQVLVDPIRLYGVRLHGPAGRFPLGRFQAVRVERMLPPEFAQGRSHERVVLLGTEGTPDILIARTSDDTGRVLGRELATVLGLKYEEERRPY